MERIRKSQRIESSKLKQKETEAQHYSQEIAKYKRKQKETQDSLFLSIHDSMNEKQHAQHVVNAYNGAIQEESIIHKQFELMKDRLQSKRNQCKDLVDSSCQILNQQIKNTRQYCSKVFQLSQKTIIPFYNTSSPNSSNLKKYHKS